MTFVGKFLVASNLILSWIFMAFAVWTYTARVDLVGKNTGLEKQLKALQAENSNNQGKAADLENKLRQRDEEYAALQTSQNNAKNAHDKTIRQLNEDIKVAREQGAAYSVTNRELAGELKSRKDEVIALRNERDKQIQAGSALAKRLSQTNDELAVAKNEIQNLLSRNRQVTDQYSRLADWVVKTRGELPPLEGELIAGDKGVGPAPPVEGVVSSIEKEGKYITISIGEDDGIKKGHQLSVWRLSPEPKYICDVEVSSTEPTRSVARPINKTFGGVIKTNDRVGPHILINRGG